MTANYSNIDQFCARVNPDFQYEVSKDENKCFDGNFPTLAQLNIAYGDGAAQDWLMPQITDLNEYFGGYRIMTARQIEQLAGMIVTDYPMLKTSEMMLFFSKLKRGMYADLSGGANPLKIYTAIDKGLMRDKYAHEQRKQKATEERERQAHRVKVREQTNNGELDYYHQKYFGRTYRFNDGEETEFNDLSISYGLKRVCSRKGKAGE